MGMILTRLTAANAGPIRDVLCDAFRDYPVMRFVLGDAPGYPERLRRLIGFFVAARVAREEPLFGIRDGSGTLLATAILSWTGPQDPSPALERLREETWVALGAAERGRYEAYGTAAGAMIPTDPHWHLNMIGVQRSHAGRGLGGRLLGAVHDHAARDLRSCGVSLATELVTNVALYQRFGYHVVGHAVVAEGLETWGMCRGLTSVDSRPT